MPPSNQDYRATYEYKKWSVTVRWRDKNCQCCGSRERGEAHHIKKSADYPELRLDLDNGIRLCYECHRYLHVIICGGYDKPCPPEALEAFLKYYSKERGVAYRRSKRLRKKLGLV